MNVAVGRLELSIRVAAPAEPLPRKRSIQPEETIPSELQFARERRLREVDGDRSRWLDSAFLRTGWKL